LTLNQKVSEQSQHRQHVQHHDFAVESRELAIFAKNKVQVHSMHKVQGELRHLTLGDEELDGIQEITEGASFAGEGSSSIVEVHEGMNQGIHRTRDPANTSDRDRRVEEEAEDKNRRVMVDVEEGNLVIVLLQDHDEGVDKLGDLGEHEQPACFCVWFILCRGRKIERIRDVRLREHIDDLTDEHVKGQDSEKNVVNHREGLHFQTTRVRSEATDKGENEEHDDVERQPEEGLHGVLAHSPVLLFFADETGMIPGSEGREIATEEGRGRPSDEALERFVDDLAIEVVVEERSHVGEEGIGKVNQDGEFAGIVLDEWFVKE